MLPGLLEVCYRSPRLSRALRSPRAVMASRTLRNLLEAPEPPGLLKSLGAPGLPWLQVPGHSELPCPPGAPGLSWLQGALEARGLPRLAGIPRAPREALKPCTIRNSTCTKRDTFDKMRVCFTVKVSRVAQLRI